MQDLVQIQQQHVLPYKRKSLFLILFSKFSYQSCLVNRRGSSVIRYGTVKFPFLRCINISPSRFVPLAFPSSVDIYLNINYFKLIIHLFDLNYFKSSSNSLQLYLVINDVNAAGIIIIGVRDGRFDESVFDVCNLSFEAAIGFGIE